MGHVWVVAGPPHPHHGHLKHGCVGLGDGSCGKCCGCVRVCAGGAAACAGVRRGSASSPWASSIRQARIRPHRHPKPHLKATPTDPTVSGVVWNQWGSLPHPFLWGVHAVPASAGAPIFSLCSLSGAWCDQAAPTGNQISRRGRIYGCVGMGGVGEGEREGREVRRGHERG